MAFNEDLAQQIGQALVGQANVEAKKMFGGVAFMVQGNMACGVINDDLIVRVGPERYDEALALPHTRVFDTTGRPMKGWVMVSPAGYQQGGALHNWVFRGIDFARSLPPK